MKSPEKCQSKHVNASTAPLSGSKAMTNDTSSKPRNVEMISCRQLVVVRHDQKIEGRRAFKMPQGRD